MAQNIQVEAIERAVVGIFLRDIQVFWALKSRIREDLFFNGRHKRIIKNMHLLADGGAVSFEFSLIAGRMGNEPGFDPVGYLYTLNEEAGDPSDVFEMIMELENLLARRRLLDWSKQAQEAAKAEKPVLEVLPEIIKSIESIGDHLGPQSSPISQVADTVVAGLYDNFEKKKTIGFSSGLVALDNLIGPLLPTRVYTIAGPPGSGKTSLAWLLAASCGALAPGCFFSQEMEPEELVVRHLAQMTGIPAFRMESGSLNAHEVEQIAESAASLKSLKVYLDGESGLNHRQIRHRAYRQKRTDGCEWLIVDHLLYCGPTERRQPMLDRIEQNMKGFKQLAKSLKIPVIVLAQLTKEYGKGGWKDVRSPQIGDIYGGAAVEHDSDVIAFVHRPEVILERKEPSPKGSDDWIAWEAEKLKWQNAAEISLGKRRGGVGYGRRLAHYDGPMMKFTDTAQKALPKPDGDPTLPEVF